MTNSTRRSLHVGLATVVLSGLVASVPLASADEARTQGTQRVIVELTAASAFDAPEGAPRDAAPSEVKAERQKVADRQQTFLANAGKAGVEPKSVRQLGLLLNAVAMTVTLDDVAELKRMPGVKAVHPDTRMRVMIDDATALVGNPQVWEREDPAGTKVRGTGTTIAVIDSGVDYTHPDLGGGFGDGHKVVAGHDFVNGDTDPMDDNSHGTHVAGIVAGKAAAEGGVTGAAPEAEITAYKVMDAGGWGDSSAIIAGIEAAADPANPHRADVINLSLGGYGDGTDPLGRAATAAVESGVVVIASAGNEGPGAYTVGTPAAAKGVIAVGASTSGIRVPVAHLAGQPEPLQTYRGLPSANPPAGAVTGSIVNIGFGTPEDWERVGDVTGRTVLYGWAPATDAGGLYNEDLRVYREAERRGAVALIGGVAPPGDGGGVGIGSPGRSNDPAADLTAGPVDPRSGKSAAGAKGEVRVPVTSGIDLKESGDDIRMDKLVVMGVDQYQGQDLAALAGTNAELTISGRDSSDEIASFSSRGPDQRMGLKPDIVAPGVEIRSTVPKAIREQGVWRMSGTSMSSPLVAGSAALLRQLHPDRTAAEIGAGLVGSAKHLDGVGELAQGAGRLDVAAAADAVLTASPSTVSFGLPDMGESQISEAKTVTLHNSGSSPVSGVVRAEGKATVSPSSVTIPAGGSATVTVSIGAGRPAGTVNYSGRISVTPDDGPALTVPYLMTAIPVYVEASPDPSDGPTTAYVYTPTTLTAPPVLTVDPPRGRNYTVPTRQVSQYYYAADLTGEHPGIYKLTARATTAIGPREFGAGAFEVTPEGSHSKKWQPIGPNSADGNVTLSPSDSDQAVMAQGGKTGSWLTTDHGKRWQQLNRTPLVNARNEPSVVIDAKNSDRWWSAMSVVSPSVGQGGILRTDDKGRTWKHLSAPDLSYTKLVADGDTKVLVAMTADRQILISRDAGETWAAEDLGLAGTVLDIAFGGDDLYLWMGREVLAVRGLGSGTPLPAEKIYSVPSDRSKVISGFDAEGQLVMLRVLGQGGGLIASQDGGRNWGAPYGNGRGLAKVSNGEIYYDNLTGDGQISRDSGKTWTAVPEPVAGSVVYDYDRWADGSYTVSAASAGIYRDGAEGYGRIGVQGASVPALAVSGNALLAGTGTGTYRTGLPARRPEWGAAESEGATGYRVSATQAYAKDTKIVWRTVEGIGGLSVQKSTDAGQTWDEKGKLDGSVRSFLVDPADPDKLTIGFDRASGLGIYSTTDGGAHWKSVLVGTYITALAADPKKPGRTWIGTYEGLYHSDDRGATRTKAADGEVQAIEFTSSRMIVGGTSIRYSTDGGQTFRTSDAGDLRMHVSDLLNVRGTLYAGTTGRWMPGELMFGGRGVLRSTDGGKTWRSISRGLQNTDVLSLAAGPKGDALYVGTELGGVHRLTLDD